MALSRRSLLKTSATCTAAAALLPGCGYDVDAAPTISAKLDDDPASARYGQIRVLFADQPDLRSLGAAVILDVGQLAVRTRPFTVPEGGVLLVHHATSDAQFIAVSALCPHASCPLGYTKKEKLIGCPCHGSRFDAAFDCTGTVLRGPARGNLRSFGVTLDPQGVTVDLNQSGACSGFTPTVENGQVVLPFTRVPELATAGGSYVTLAITGLPGGLAVARIDANTAKATSAACTHLQCPVQLQNQEWFCNCHFSRFDLSGAVKAGPATAPLTPYTATVGKDAITVKIA